MFILKDENGNEIYENSKVEQVMLHAVHMIRNTASLFESFVDSHDMFHDNIWITYKEKYGDCKLYVVEQ